MGRTLPSATQNLHSQEGSLARFRRALRRRDQLVLDDLFDAAYKHIAAVAYAANLMPFETYLLCMLLEEHKAVMRLQDEIAALKDRHDSV